MHPGPVRPAGAIHSPVNFVYIVNLKLPRGLLTLEEGAQACIISKKQEMSLKLLCI